MQILQATTYINNEHQYLTEIDLVPPTRLSVILKILYQMLIDENRGRGYGDSLLSSLSYKSVNFSGIVPEDYIRLSLHIFSNMLFNSREPIKYLDILSSIVEGDFRSLGDRIELILSKFSKEIDEEYFGALRKYKHFWKYSYTLNSFNVTDYSNSESKTWLSKKIPYLFTDNSLAYISSLSVIMLCHYKITTYYQEVMWRCFAEMHRYFTLGVPIRDAKVMKKLPDSIYCAQKSKGNASL